MNIHKHITTRHTDERGISMIIFVILLPVLIGFLALVIDSSRKQYSAIQLQSAADAAALAGADNLNGTLEGWRSAKRAIVRVLEQNPLFGAQEDIEGKVFLIDGHGDPAEKDSIYFGGSNSFSGTEASISNVKITVERGAYWFQNGTWEFVSFEDTPVNESETARSMFGIDAYHIANAVRVTMQMDSLLATFARVPFIGATFLGDLDRDAIAVTHAPDLQPQQIFPAAIPACDLLFGLSQEPPLKTEVLESNLQCNRHVVLTEANIANASEERQEGFYRYQLYNFRNISGELNGWSVPLRGTFGIPGSGASSVPAGPTEVRDAISAPTSIRIGQTWNPLEQDVGFNSPDVQNAIRNFIMAGTSQFWQTYCTDPACTNMRANFPRKIHWTAPMGFPDRSNALLAWPTAPGVYSSMNLDDYGIGRKENVLCHDPGIPKTYNAPVQTITLPVVAPRNEESRYCDFDKMVDGEQPDAQDMFAMSDPVVVGFVRVSVHDGNILPLGETGATMTNPHSFPASQFDDPILDDYQEDLEEYRAQHGSWRDDCLDQYQCEQCENRPPWQQPNCFATCCTQDPPEVPDPPIPGSTGQWFDACVATDDFNLQYIGIGGIGVANWWQDDAYDDNVSEFEQQLESGWFTDPVIPAVPNCLARRVDYPVDAPSSYIVGVHQIGTGCGGVEGMLQCEGANKRLFSPTTVDQHRPALVR